MITRLGLSGTPRSLYGSFAGRTPTPVFIPPVPKFHSIVFSSVSQGFSFESEQRDMTFTSVSQSITLMDSEEVELSFLVKEDGFKFLLENGNGVLRE